MNDDIYQKGFETHGESPKAMHWVNYASQAVRLKNLLADLELENKTILDAGCGMGDALPFIYAKADNFDYLGVDTNEDFIATAKKRFTGHRFKVADPFFGKFNQKFDVVISSGVMNHNVPNWLEVRKQMISRLFDLSLETLAFNMAGGFHHIPNNSKIAYANAQEIYDFCATLSESLSIKTDYSPYDFTIVMDKST